jgi:hypothetical protein
VYHGKKVATHPQWRTRARYLNARERTTIKMMGGKQAMVPSQNDQRFHQEADRLRQTERERLRALVEANIEVATRLHADDFQLITPSGRSLSKAEYLGGVASGDINYLVWEPGAIEVRVQEQMAVIRYRSELELGIPGETLQPGTTHRGHYWHLDVYEKHQETWQIVWSQATEIQEPGNP